MRQSTKPLKFPTSRRQDNSVGMTTFKAGTLELIDFIPVLRGDSVSASMSITAQLGEMPKPLLNGVTLEVQAWFCPKSAMPQFESNNDFLHSITGEKHKTLGATDREPAPFFFEATAADIASDYPLLKTTGIHAPTGWTHNTDLIDAYALVVNTRREMRSSKMTKHPYFHEDNVNAGIQAQAFWPKSRLDRMVPDYEQALIVGALELDFSAGSLPVSIDGTDVTTNTPDGVHYSVNGNAYAAQSLGGSPQARRFFADFIGTTATTTLADIDKARQTQAFAKLRQSMAGTDVSGYISDEMILSQLMQGLAVPEDLYQRPWLLDSKTVLFGMNERFSTDANDLSASLSEGATAATLNMNVPKSWSGGNIIITAAVVPERVFERQADDAFLITDADHYPNELRDSLEKLPVEPVTEARIDTASNTPSAIYGYEPLNDRWNREMMRLGGKYYLATPSGDFSEARSNIWLTEATGDDVKFNDGHWLAPENFPQDVFSDTTADCVEMTFRRRGVITGHTVFGDMLREDNDEYEDTAQEAQE